MDEEFSNSSNLPEYLRVYYQYLFPHSLFYQWLSYANVEPDYFSRREFSFTLPDDIYLRYNSFDNLAEMRRSIMERLPNKIDLGAVFNSKPKDSKKMKLFSFQAIERELVFDIDLTDYDDVRTCCDGAKICEKCWKFMVVAARILEGYLREDFGFKNILWVYSGRRGIHCWVADERARRLKSNARDAISNFINIFDGGHFKAKKVTLDGFQSVHPSLVRSIKIIDKYFEDLMIKGQDFLKDKNQVETIVNLCTEQQLRNDIRKAFLVDTSLTKSKDKWEKIENLTQNYFRHNGPNNFKGKNSYRNRFFLEEVKLQLCFPRLDINVTRGLNHLLKVPFSVHPKTGRICVPIEFEKIDEFDPFNVPTISKLCKELDEISVANENNYDSPKESIENNINGNSSAGLVYKTSLAPSLNLFRQFIVGIEQSLKSSKLANNDDKMSF